MAKDAQRTLMPKLRFPEFRDRPEWKESLLGSEATFHKGRGVSKAQINADGQRPCIRYGELYTRYDEVIDVVISRTSAAESGLFLSCKNDVIIPASGETKEDIAKASCVMLDGVALGSDLNVIRSRHNGVFLSYLLNGAKKREIATVAQGDTVVHLYPSQLEQISITFPEVREQRKISDCLMSLDELIVPHERKVEALKTQKKGLIQQLFPRVGEIQPCLRFPKFRDRGDWESRKIGDLLEKVSQPVSVEPNRIYQEIGIRSHGKGIFHKDPVTGAAIGTKRVFRVVPDAFILNIIFAWEQAVASTTKNEAGMIASHRFPMYVSKGGRMRCTIS